ncbi:MAG: HEAT repeat domain-containing protein [Chloroflexi bacterium]|nr:MAG: HEAT repeat domain-containing protein [Chloroflexota bacterium]MBL1193325.1 HEAT repeat domain-containing protein [Chloroflexota bacterium]NOH10617.1 HEAT repeat domain-containing protein [Chloroflexota bacterium]
MRRPFVLLETIAMGNIPGLDTLISHLTSGNDADAEAAAQQIAAYGQEGIQRLATILSSADPDERWWVVRSLAEFDHPDASRLIILTLKDTDKAVQQCAALALREKPDPKAVPHLVALLGDDDRLLAHLAADALAAIGPPATKALLEVVENGADLARIESVRALAQYEDHASIPTLFKLLDEDSALLEYWANEGLENMGIGMRFFWPG